VQLFESDPKYGLKNSRRKQNMALFDSIIGSSIEKFGLSKESSGGLLAALVGLIADPKSGGFGGFLDKFRNAGLGSAVDSWITTGDNGPLSDNQVESALGAEAIGNFADQAGVDRGTATSALAGMIPGVVDTLTPDGEVPDEASLLTRIGGFLSDWGGAIGGAVAGGVGAAAAMAGGAADKAGAAAGVVGDRVSGAVRNVGNTFDTDTGGSGSILKWLLPLLLLLLLIALGWMFCGRGTAPTGNTNANVNANRTNANANANRVNTNANTNAAVNTTAGAPRTLSEVTLANGTKLQAYPGGIEDQLVKFIQSDEYKKAASDQLKEKWFSFDDLNFKFGTTELAPESKRQLDNIVAILKAYPDVKMKIGGYTDKKGDDAANLKLSDSRAKAVQAALQKAGVGTQVPEAEGYGEKFATIDENGSDEARKVDRKTEVRLIK
jgi:uncharacterized protein YidB (DUF937 family)/outer membrane protein OmpA-like peptidoglycan-associated protein